CRWFKSGPRHHNVDFTRLPPVYLACGRIGVLYAGALCRLIFAGPSPEFCAGKRQFRASGTAKLDTPSRFLAD
ncbi:MAG: hypothetical protein RMJ15_09785, partial [Nitrososphaerota archaeon]|nr:hypothetical protein [Nitrososphaerota archaeon]